MLKGKWCLVLTDIMSVIGYITQTIYIFYWKLYIIYISYAYARINNGIIRTKLAIVKVLNKYLRTHLSTPLRPLRGPPPRPPGQGRLEKVQPCVRTPVQPTSVPSRGAGNTYAHLRSQFLDKMLLFKLLCFTWNSS